MRAVLLLWRVQSDVDRFFLARNVQLLAVRLIILVDHLQLYRAFGYGRKMGDTFLIALQLPVDPLVPAELCIIARAKKIENHGGIFNGLIELVLDQDLDRRSLVRRRRERCRQPGEDSKQRNSELHASIIAQRA